MHRIKFALPNAEYSVNFKSVFIKTLNTLKIPSFLTSSLDTFFSGTFRVDVLKKDDTFAVFSRYCSLHV